MTSDNKSRYILYILAAIGLAAVVYYSSPVQLPANSGDNIVKIVASFPDHDPTTVTLRVPEGIRYGSAIGTNTSDYFNIITTYRAIAKQLISKQTFSGSNCSDYCDDKLMVSLSIIPESWVRTRAEIYYGEGAGAGLVAHKPIWSQTSVVDHDPTFGFNKIFDVIKPMRPQANITRYFINDANDGKTSDIVVGYCWLSTVFHSCKFSFVLACEPRLNIDITGWPYEQIDKFGDVKSNVSSFIKSMIVAGQCDEGAKK